MARLEFLENLQMEYPLTSSKRKTQIEIPKRQQTRRQADVKDENSAKD